MSAEQFAEMWREWAKDHPMDLNLPVQGSWGFEQYSNEQPHYVEPLIVRHPFLHGAFVGFVLAAIVWFAR